MQKTAQLADIEGIENLQFFREELCKMGVAPLKSKGTISTMQMNIGLVCNLSCKHCHVEAGPNRTEVMSQDIMEHGLRIMSECGISKLDITGGAPELNPHFTWLVEEAAKRNLHVIVRTNLTVLDDENFEYLPEFFAKNRVEVVCSLPYYTEKNADRIRGNGVFNSSIKMLKRLNELGYGREGSSLTLNLVYNPGGAFLPGAQEGIEVDYRKALQSQYGVTFTNLFALGNFPVGRFLTFLKESGNLQPYMQKLASVFNPDTVAGVMCRDQISLSYDGKLYDCDFNQALGLPCEAKHISTCDKQDIFKRDIAVSNHCYACTAGSGSSCGGAVV